MDPFIVYVRSRDCLVLYQCLWLWGAIRVCLAHEMSSSVAAAFQGEWGVISYQPGSLQDKVKHPFSLQSKQSGCRYLLVVCTEFPWTLHTTQILIPLMDLSPFRLFLVEWGPGPGLQSFAGRDFRWVGCVPGLFRDVKDWKCWFAPLLHLTTPQVCNCSSCWWRSAPHLFKQGI